MPVRLLRDWTDSAAVNSLSAEAERMFVRLIQKADDFGRYTADLKLLRPYLFPLQLESTREASLERWLHELESARLVRRYVVGGKPYLEIEKFGQRIRSDVSRYPDPPTPGECQTVDSTPPSIDSTPPSGVSHPRPETETETETIFGDGDGYGRVAPLPAPVDLLRVWNSSRAGLPEAKGLSDGRKRHAKARLAEVPDLARWGRAIQRLARSSFATGTNDRGWRADLDFLLQPDALTKIEEGKYDNRGPEAPLTEKQKWEKRVDAEGARWVAEKEKERLEWRAKYREMLQTMSPEKITRLVTVILPGEDPEFAAQLVAEGYR